MLSAFCLLMLMLTLMLILLSCLLLVDALLFSEDDNSRQLERTTDGSICSAQGRGRRIAVPFGSRFRNRFQAKGIRCMRSSHELPCAEISITSPGEFPSWAQVARQYAASNLEGPAEGLQGMWYL